ncbi:MAG: SIS domain-containing protein [archaeon]|nr:SIS domain-containing protein [archaeon]
MQPQLAEEMRTKHPYFTHDMIVGQPSALHATLEICKKEAADITSYWGGNDKFVLTGCGTSFHAALASSYMLYSLFQKTGVEAIQSFELEHYYNLLGSNSLLMAFSHTGFTKTTLDAMMKAKVSGARTFAITGVKESPITRLSGRSIVVGNGREKSRAHTVSYTCAILAAMYLSAYYTQSQTSSTTAESFLEQFNDIPQSVLSTIEHYEKQVAELASSLSKTSQFFFVGSGPNIATAYEASLKMKETNYSAAEAMETEQFLHGPWVSLKPSTVVFLAATRGPSRQRNVDLLRICKDLSVPTIAITDDKHLVELAKHSIFMPDVSEELSPLEYIVPLQLFAYYTSLSKGINPDMIHYDDPRFWTARQIIFPPGTH